MLDVLRLWVRSRMSDDRGASMVEYGLLVALIAIIAAFAAVAVGVNLAALFTRVANCLLTPGVCA